MKYRLLTKYPVIKQWLTSQLGYFADDMYQLADAKLAVNQVFDPRVIIVAKCHYQESWQSFSAINKKDAKKIVKLKQQNVGEAMYIFQLFANKSIDGFDLKTTVFSEQLLNKLGIKKILIPETELYYSQSLKPYVLQVDTPKGVLFSGGHCQQSISSYAQGLLRDVATYKLSIGIPAEVKSKVIEKQDLAGFLLSQLHDKPIAKIISQLAYKPWSWLDFKQLHYLYLAPLTTAVVFYIVTNSYFFLYNHYLESELAAQSEKISTVLGNKSNYDKQRALLVQLSTELNARNAVHYHWHIIEQLFDEGMTITRISLKKNILLIRGKADKASRVLEAMTTNKYLQNISFQGQVRKSRDQDLFTLAVLPNQPLFDIPQKNQAFFTAKQEDEHE